MRSKKILMLGLVTTMLMMSFTGCGKTTPTQQTTPITKTKNDVQAIEYAKEDVVKINDNYLAGEIVEVSGTRVKMGEKYMVEAYGGDVEVIDLDFINYGFGITLPTSVFNPDNVYYLTPQANGSVNITTKDANKILLNFMDDVRFTLVSYNYGMFSTWASSYDETTYYNLKRCQPKDIVALVEETGFIEYQEGYRIAKYYDMYEDDAYRIEMEVDVYPFKGNTDFSYHGYLTMLCYDGIMRSIVFAEPKFDENNPYQLIYPVSRSTFWLNIGVDWDTQPTNTEDDNEVENREVVENQSNDSNNDFDYTEWPSYINENNDINQSNIEDENKDEENINDEDITENNKNNENDEIIDASNNDTNNENKNNDDTNNEDTNNDATNEDDITNDTITDNSKKDINDILSVE